MDLGKFLRDRKKDVVKRWQNSVVLDAVSANTEADKQRRQQQASTPVPKATNQPSFKPLDNSFTRGLSRGIDQINIFDNNRTWQQTDPTQSKSSFQQLGQFGGQAARGMVSPVAKTVNTGAAAVNVANNLRSLAQASITGTDESYKKTLDNITKSNDRWIAPGSGVLGTGSWFKNKDEATNIGTKDLAGRILGAGAETYLAGKSMKMGGFTGKNILEQGLRKGITSQAPILAKTGAVNALQGGVEVANKGGDASQIVQGGLLSAGLGTLSDVGLGIGGAAVSAPMRSITDNAASVIKGKTVASVINPTKTAPPVIKQEVIKQSPVLQQTGIPAQPGSLRERIQIAKENVTNTVASKLTPLNTEGSVEVGSPLIPIPKRVVDSLQGDTPKIGRDGVPISKTEWKRQDGDPINPYSKIHPADQDVMAVFIDHARGINKKTGDEAYRLELEASNIAEGYELGTPNTPAKLANLFAKELERAPSSNKVRGVAKQSQMSKQTPKRSIFTKLNDEGSAQVGGPLIPLPKKLIEKLQGGEQVGKTVDDTAKVTFGELHDSGYLTDDVAAKLGKQYGLNADQVKSIGKEHSVLSPTRQAMIKADEAQKAAKSAEKPKVSMQEGRANQVLDKKIRYNGKVMTRSEYVDALKVEGYAPTKTTNNGKTKYSMKSSKGDYYDVTKIEYDRVAPQVGKTPDTSDRLVEYMNQELYKGQGTPDMAFKRVAKRFDGKDNYLLGGKQSVTAEQLKDATYKAKVADFNKEPKYATEQFISSYVKQHGLDEADFRRYLANAKSEVAPQVGKTDAVKQAQETAKKTEALKKQGKITPEDDGYWSTPIKDQPKAPMPDVKDTNGLTPMEGDKIEFDSILGDSSGKTKKGTATIRWSEPSIANASGKQVKGEWLGNGTLEGKTPFTIIERNGKPIAAKKPTKPLSTPVDTTPAIAKQVTKKSAKRQVQKPTLSQKEQPNLQKAQPLTESTQPQILKESLKVLSSTDNTAKSRFAQRGKTSEEISPELQKQIKTTTYTKQVNEKQIETSDKLIAKGYKKAAVDVSARLDAKDSGADAQTVSDTIAVIKKLDEKGNPTNHQQASELFDKLSARLTEAGQTVQAASLLYNRTPQGLYYSAQRTLKKAGVELTPKLDAELKTLLKDVKATKADSEEGGLARFKFIEKVNKSVPSGRLDKAVQIWKAGLLSGPITQVGNATANTFEQGTKRLYEDPVATGVDMLMSVFTGKRSKSLTGRGVLSGSLEGAQKGVKYFKTGYDPRNPSQKFDVREVHYSDTPLGRAAEKYTQTIFKAMGTADQPFYYASMRNSLYDQAITEAKNQGLKGMKRAAFIKQYTTEPSKKAMQLADNEAKYDVFQNKTKLGEAASGLKGKTGALGDFVVPFSGVPSSIATRIVERTPIGTATEIVSQMKSGKFDQRRMAQAIARGTTGVVLVGVGKALAESGLMTLGYPQDEDERKLWELEKKQAFSIKVGGSWRSLNYFQPAGTIIAAGAAYQKAKEEGKSESDAWATAVANTGKAFTEQSFLKGVSGTINALTDPQRAGEKFAENTAGSLVPNFLRAPTRAYDNKQRKTTNVVESIQAGIPGQRQKLPVKNNPFGEDLNRVSSGWNALLNPTKPSDIKDIDSTTKELRRLQDAGVGIMPTTIQKDFLGKDTDKLNDKQISELERKINPQVKSTWDKVVATAEYKKLSDEDKMKTLRRVKEDLTAIGKRQYSAENTVGEYAQDYSGKQSKLTKSQVALMKGGDVSKYIRSSDAKDTPLTYKEKYQEALDEYNDKDNGYSDIDKISKTKSLNKLRVQKDYSDDVNDLYGLSKDDIYSYVTTSDNGQKTADDLIKLDKALYDAGITKYLKFKNGIAPTAKGGGSSSSSSQSATNSLKLDTLSKLNSLLAGIGSPVTSRKKVGARQASTKKITVKK